MAALPQIKRLTREDFKDAPDWINRLLYPINLFFDAVYSALNKGLNFQQNFAAQIQSFTITAGVAATDNTANFILTMTTKPQGLILLNASLQNGSLTPIGAAVYLDWNYDGTNINISSITGLTNGTIYTFTVLVI